VSNKKIFNNIKSIVKELNTLSKSNLEIFTNIVDDIIVSNSKDEKHIELTLDRLLDFCYDDENLLLYKKLCRYYLTINPIATEDYVKFYFEMYGEDDDS
jgi:hypothetical protein